MTRPKFTSEQAREAGKKSKRKPFDQEMREWLYNVQEINITMNDGTKKTVKQNPVDLMRAALLFEASKGNVQAIREAFNRAFGQAKQHVTINDENEVRKSLEEASDEQLKAIEKILLKNKKV